MLKSFRTLLDRVLHHQDVLHARPGHEELGHRGFDGAGVRDVALHLEGDADGVGVKHEDGRIDTEESGPISVTPERLRAAADDVAARFPLDEVVTYFLTLLLQDAETWSGAIGWLESRSA